MAGTWTNLNVKDASGTTQQMRVWDESGVGSGPYSFGGLIGDGSGSGNAIGSLTETAPASDTASSGLNGRMQRIAQRITSLIALLPTALGAGGGLKVDGSGMPLPVSGTFYQATQPVSASSLPLPSNAAQETGGNLATVANAQGTSGSGITQPTGGSGILGWLSGIFNKLNTSIAVTGTFWQTTQPVSAASLPLPTGAALEAGNLATIAGAVTSSRVQANVAQIAGTTPDVNSGNKSSGTLRVVLATDQPQLTNKLLVTPDSVAAAASENHVGAVGGNKSRVSASKTRPANTTAYAAKSAISESTSSGTVWTFSSVARITGGTGYIVRATLLTDQTSNTESFRLHLYNASPTAINDGSACTSPLYADASKYVGTINFAACAVEGSGATAAYSNTTPNTSSCNLPLAFACAADANLYGILETPNGFTPASGQNITIVLMAEND